MAMPLIVPLFLELNLMNVWTVQFKNKLRAEARGIEVVDTSIKSGVKAFAPSWDIVMGHKEGRYSDKQYTDIYLSMMRQSFASNNSQWLTLADSKDVALMCYCPVGAFCHRLILADIFEKICKQKGIPFAYLGEVK